MTILFLLGLLNVNSLLTLWFFSPIKNTIGKIFFKKDLSPMQFDDYLFVKNKILGELTSCWICCSFWLSLLVGAAYTFIFSLSPLWPLLTFLSYPCISYLFYIIVKR